MTNKWQVKKLNDLCDVRDGTHDSPKFVHDGYPLITSKNLIESDLDFNNVNYISENDYKAINRRSAVDDGDILLGMIGTIGNPVIVNKYREFAIKNVALIKFNSSIINNRYLLYFLKSNLIEDQFKKVTSGSTQKFISLGTIRNLDILLPDISEQLKIGDILSSIDEAIQKTDQIIQKSEELKSGLMNELLTKGIGHKKFKKTKLGEIPEDWNVISLQDLINTGYITSHLDGNHGELYPKSSEFTSEGIPYISANNLKSNRVDFKGSKYLSESRAKQFKKGVALNGDVLFAHNATVGPVALLKTNYPFVILSTSLTYYRCDISKLDPEYLLNYMQSEIFKAQYQRIMSQTTRNQVPITAQRALFHIVPPIKEQLEISKILSSLDANVSKNILEKVELINLKNGLMSDIFYQKVTIN